MAGGVETGKPGEGEPVKLSAGMSETRKPDQQSEWLVSDRRGPIAKALDDGGEVLAGETPAHNAPTNESSVESAFTHRPTDAGESAVTGHLPRADTGVTDHVLGDHALGDNEGRSGLDGPEAIAHTGKSEPIDPEIAPAATDSAAWRTAPGASGASLSGGAADTSASSVSSPAEREKRRSVVPLALAVLVGAAIGAGSAALVYAQYSPANNDDKLATLANRIETLEKRPDPGGRVDALAGKVAGLEKQVAGFEKPAVTARPAQSGSGDAALAAKLAALQASVAALQKQPAPQGSGDANTQKTVESLQSTLASLKAEQQATGSKLDKMSGSLAETEKQVAAAQNGLSGVRDQQKTLAQHVAAPAIAVVADGLAGEVAAGKPYGRQLDALRSLGADNRQLEALAPTAATGVASSAVLLARFEPLADPVVAAADHAPANAGFLARLKRGFFNLVSIRRADSAGGTDASSLVSRIEADLRRDDVDAAYATWSSLPADARSRSSEWGAEAKKTRDARTAARALQSESIGSLTTNKS